VGLVNIDLPRTDDGSVEKAIEAIRGIAAVKSACLVRFN
jgi:hypothetical protein